MFNAEHFTDLIEEFGFGIGNDFGGSCDAIGAPPPKVRTGVNLLLCNVHLNG
jgi:hypothetical protein